MRRWGILVGLAILATGITAVPAAADPPVEFTDSFTFEDLNACDAPNTHEVTITFNLKLHEHQNNTVYVFSSWATSDTGFEGPGHEARVVADGDVFTDTFTFIQKQPETGELATVKGRITFANGEMRVDTFEQRCVRDV